MKTEKQSHDHDMVQIYGHGYMDGISDNQKHLKKVIGIE